MQYTRPMVELVMQIRKWMPSELKADVKLANPNLFNILALHYHDKCDVITQALIKELFNLAGDKWPDLLKYPESPKPKSTVKIYRGQTRLEEKPPEVQLNNAAIKKPTRFYRGVAIQD